ncbi:MAG: autotransporter domain-containing protein, partial [Acidaminococcaceae bacterium]|nr:autotransporter domain-containing protein [Acidaminococcaceae bacterium]
MMTASIFPVYASEIIETKSDESHYIEFDYDHDSQYYFQDRYEQQEDMVRSANASSMKTFHYDSTWVLLPLDGEKVLDSFGGVAYGGYLADTADEDRPNALMIRLYNSQKNEYEYRALATTMDDGVLWSINDYVNTNIFSNPTYAKKLYDLIHANDADGIQNFMKEYLPKFYLVKLSQEELDRANEIISSYDEMLWFGNEGTFTDYVAANPDTKTEIDVMHELRDWGETVQNSTDSRTYSSINLQSGEEWRPMDRTIALSAGEKAPFSDQNDYSINSYWMAKDGKISPNPNYDPDFSQWGFEFDEQTVLSYDDSTQGGTTPVSDYSQTILTVGELTADKGSIINMTWANTNPLSGDTGFNTVDNSFAVREDTISDSSGNAQTVKTFVKRTMFVDSAKLGEGATFRVGGYSHLGTGGDRSFYNKDFDSVYIRDAVPLGATSSPTNLYIQLGYVPGLEKGNSFGGVALGDTNYDSPVFSNGLWNMHGYVPVFGILNGSENFNVSGQESRADGVFNVYTVKPEVEKLEDYFVSGDTRSGTLWYLTGYTFQNTGEVAESGKNASDNALVNQNLWRGFSDHAFRRPADFHTRYAWSREEKQAARENAWAETWHGRFNSKGDYGRSVGQSYTGLMVGYDKMLNKEYGGGNIYTGVYAARLDGSSHTPSQGRGDQEGSGFGVYGSWVGQKGHYIDAEASAIKLKNRYHFYGNNGKGLQQIMYTPTGASSADTTGNGTYGNVKGENNTWAYGLGLRYGKRSDRGSVWFDPHVSVYAGHIDKDSYTLSNDLIVNTKDWDSLVGKAGITVGKQLAGNKGRVYAGVDIAREFGGKQEIEQAIVAHAQDGTTGTG